MHMNEYQTTNYNNESITSLKGADRVRLRPSVIFGSDGLEGCQHSIFEILSNSIDEAREGYGNLIEVTRYKDHSVAIKDYGRGIPVDTTGNLYFVNYMQVENIKIILAKTMSLV